MSKTPTKAKLRKYKREWDAEKRKGTVVSARFDDETIEGIDQHRGETSRTAYVKAAVIADLKSKAGDL